MKIKNIIGSVLLLTVWALPGHAQIGEQRHNLAVGFNGGININSVSFSPTVRQKSLMGINGGLSDNALYLRKVFQYDLRRTSGIKFLTAWLERI